MQPMIAAMLAASVLLAEGCRPSLSVSPKETRDGTAIEADPVLRSGGARMRQQAIGGWEKDIASSEVRVPEFIVPSVGKAALSLFDKLGDVYLALYREEYAYNEETGEPIGTCESAARIYQADGRLLSETLLHRYFSAAGSEVRDIHYDGGILYFNEVTLASADGPGERRLGSILAVDTRVGSLQWRAEAVSTGRFLLAGEYLLSVSTLREQGDDTHDVFLVRRADGKVVASEDVIKEDGLWGFKQYADGATVVVFDHEDVEYDFRKAREGVLARWDGPKHRDKEEARRLEQLYPTK